MKNLEMMTYTLSEYALKVFVGSISTKIRAVSRPASKAPGCASLVILGIHDAREKR